MSSPNDGKVKTQVLYPKYTHTLLTWLEFTKDVLWTWMFKAVREQGSTSRKEK